MDGTCMDFRFTINTITLRILNLNTTGHFIYDKCLIVS